LGTVGPALILAEVAAVLLAGLVTGGSSAPLLVATLVAVLAAWAADLHRPRLVLSILDDLPGLLVAAASATAVLVGSGASAIASGVLTFACLVLAHTTVHGVTLLLRRLGRLGRRVLVDGTGVPARQLASTLLLRSELGLRPVGFVGTGGAGSLDQARGLPLALVGSVATLPRAMTEARVDAVVVALSGPPGEDETAAVAGLLATAAEVYAVPTWLPQGLPHPGHPREVVGDLHLVRLQRRATWPPLRALRRLVEVLVAALALLAVLPVFAVLALLVLVETGGVLVHRPWLVEPGRPGPPLRFRTRRSRSVARPGTTFSVAIPGRMGPVGRLLGITGLDALPDVMRVLLRRVRYAGGVPDAVPVGSAPAPSPDQPQVDTGQLAG
jgi:hypothetical protein